MPTTWLTGLLPQMGLLLVICLMSLGAIGLWAGATMVVWTLYLPERMAAMGSRRQQKAVQQTD